MYVILYVIIMYKTISISNNTFQNLHAIASRLAKPKSQVIDDLVKERMEGMEEEEKKKLQAHNEFMDSLAKRVKLPKGTKVSTDNLDEQFSVLADEVGEF